MRTNIEFKATGGELFKQLFVGFLLCSITLGIYYPWFLVSLQRMIMQRTTVRSGDEELRLDYTATGGQLFKHMFLGYLFTIWTFGIYLPWFVMRMIRFQQEHTVAIGASRSYRFHTELTGGELFKTLIGGYLLTGITFGIYMPWFLVKLVRTLVEATELHSDQERLGTIRFTLTGGELFKTFIVGYLLTAITLGIYGFWFQVKMLKLFANSTEISVRGRAYRGDFTGTGGEAFKVNFLGYLLTMITFGVYSFWYMANLLRFQLGNTRFVPAEELDGEGEALLMPARVSSMLGDAHEAAPARALAAPKSGAFAGELAAGRAVPVVAGRAIGPGPSGVEMPSYAAAELEDPVVPADPYGAGAASASASADDDVPVYTAPRALVQAVHAAPRAPVHSAPRAPVQSDVHSVNRAPMQSDVHSVPRAPMQSDVPVYSAPAPVAARAPATELVRAQRPAPIAPSSVPARRAVSAPVDAENDRRAAWAQAFLPARTATAPSEPEFAATLADQNPLALEVAEVWTDRAVARAPGQNPIN